MTDWLKQAKQSGHEIEQRGWFKFVEVGDHIVGRVEEYRDAGKVGPQIRMTCPDGEQYPVALSGNLPNFGIPQLVGNVIGIFYVSEMDVGQISPMKVYDVVNFGDGASVPADMPPRISSGELPF